MKSRKSIKNLRGGRNDLSYVNPNYSIPSTSAGNNILVPIGNIVRPSLSIIGGSKTKTRRQRGAGLPFPIASRNISRNEPLYPAIHARLIGGANRTHRQSRNKHSRINKSNRTHRGGFSPAIMGPLIDNFHYIAPAVGLVAYRYYDQIKGKLTKRRRTHRKQ
jgi:hypothetical protein